MPGKGNIKLTDIILNELQKVQKIDQALYLQQTTVILYVPSVSHYLLPSPIKMRTSLCRECYFPLLVPFSILQIGWLSIFIV